MAIENLAPETRLSDLTVSDLMDLIGWALSYYRSAQGEDTAGFVAAGPSLIVDAPNERWRSAGSRWWSTAPSSNA